MNDSSIQQPPPTLQTPIYQTPDWETPRSPPPKRSPLATLKETWHLRTTDKETLTRLPTNTSLDLGTTTTNKPSILTTLLDKLLPPNRKYLHLTRKRFLLFIILPLLIIFLFILPIGLGVGLTKNKSQNRKLPIDTGGIWSGDLTYYAPGLGACGIVSGEDENVVALSHLLFDQFQAKGADPNQNPLCGKKIRIRRDFVEEGNGERSVDVTVVDRCTGCDWTDLDVSPGVFEQLAREVDGRVTASWAWLDRVEPPA